MRTGGLTTLLLPRWKPDPQVTKGPMNLCSTTVRHSLMVCRITDTFSPGTSKTLYLATERCVESEWSAVLAGTVTDCPPKLKRNGNSVFQGVRRLPIMGSRSSMITAAPRFCSTPRSGSATSPDRPAGWTFPMTTRRLTCPIWRVSCGPLRVCGTKASFTRVFAFFLTRGRWKLRCRIRRLGLMMPTGMSKIRRSRWVLSWKPASGFLHGQPPPGPCHPTWP